MNKFLLLLLLAICSITYGEKITILFREPLNGEDVRRVKQAVQRCRCGDTNRIGIVIKKTSVVLQGARDPLHTIAVHLPLELQKTEGIDGKLAHVMQLDPLIINDREAEKLVWDVKDIIGINWKIFRGTRMHTASDAPKFDPDDVYDAHGNFKQESIALFYSLPISEEERNKIYELIDKMGTQPWYKLMWNHKHLEKIGQDIDAVHPLRFASTIFSNSHLKNCMKEVKEFAPKWERFCGGFIGKMEKNYAKRNILPYLPGYCIETGANYKKLVECVQAKNWKGFLEHMVDN